MNRFKTHRQSGFTLLELMVSLTIGLIAILAAYTLSRASTEGFHNQQRIAQTQLAVRMAADQIRNDVQRAGFLAVPSTATARRCTPMPDAVEFGAVEVRDEMDTGNLPNAAANRVQADRLRLIGNYATTSRYVIDSAVGDRVRIDASTQGFRDSFGITGDNYDEDAFNNVFRTGRYIHIEDLDGDHFFLRITGVDGGTQSLTVTPSLNNGSGDCVSGAMRQSFVSPLMRIEYAVVDAVNAPNTMANLFGDGAQQALDQARGTTPTLLIRREVSFDAAAAPVPNSERIVLDHVADFSVDLAIDQNAGVVAAGPSIALAVAGQAQTVSVNTPEQVRSLIVSLAGRTADQEEGFPFVPRLDGAPLTRYQVNPAIPGAARIRQTRFEVFLPNVAP